MPKKIELTQELIEEYKNLFSTMLVRRDKITQVDRIVDKILVCKDRYVEVATATKIPWFFIAAVHNMESGCSMLRHLHNGDPLTARTVQVPAGRPLKGNPPFTWVESAMDALQLRKLDKVLNWTPERLLFELEGYNGWGYRRYHPEVKSPYLWSFSNHYASGKYVADGKWDANAPSKQCGAAVIVKALINKL